VPSALKRDRRGLGRELIQLAPPSSLDAETCYELDEAAVHDTFLPSDHGTRRMKSSQLANKRVLVVEDDYLVAMDIARALERAGAEVIGPAPAVAAALDALERTVPDGAILDINLGGEMAFPVADALIALGVPFIFATGYDAQVIPVRFTHVKRCEKPMASEQICAALFASGVAAANDRI
jgi:ActR/RegA family two-component response regulator